MPLFPPLVTGVVITSIGLSIIQVGIDWAAGGKGNPQYGNPVYLGISFAVLIFILLITRYAKRIYVQRRRITGDCYLAFYFRG